MPSKSKTEARDNETDTDTDARTGANIHVHTGTGKGTDTHRHGHTHTILLPKVGQVDYRMNGCGAFPTSDIVAGRLDMPLFLAQAHCTV